MTIFGPDVSSYQRGINIAALPDPFVLLKACEGTYYVDATYQAFLAQARAAGKVVIPYHFVTTEDPDLQAAFIAAHIIDTTLPLMLDVEPQTQTGSRPSVAMVAALIDRCRARGLNPRLVYLPRWYWEQLGSPPLTPLASRGQGLISSEYPGGQGYPGDDADGWSAYGGMTPLLYQFTDVAVEGGQTVGDRNAYRGTLADLTAFLGAATPTNTGGPTMSDGIIPASITSQDPDLPDLASKFPAGQPFDGPTALIWTDERAAAANEHARQARDAVAALQTLTTADDTAAAAHLQQISASLDALTALVHTLGGAASAAPADVQALATALAPALAAQLPAHLTLTVGAK